MESDGTLKRELAETDQIIALATKVEALQTKIADQQKTIALATSTSGNHGNGSTGSGQSDTRRGQRQPYRIKPWCLEFKGPTTDMNGTKWSWYTKDHWRAGVKHSGMHCMHNTSKHDAWRKEHDDK